MLRLLLLSLGFIVPLFPDSLFDDLHKTGYGLVSDSGNRSPHPLSETNIDRRDFNSGNVLLAQASTSLANDSEFPTFSEKSYLASAAIRTIERNVMYLKKYKLFEPGSTAKFQSFANVVNDVFPLDQYRGDRKLETRAIASRDLYASGYKVNIYLKYYAAIGSHYEYKDLPQKDVERDIWHELIHVYEFSNSTLDEKFSKYNKSGLFSTDDIFTERHASFFDDLITALDPLSQRIEEGRGTLFSIKDAVIRIYELSRKEFWSEWSEADFQADLSGFYRDTGIRLDIDRIRNINEHTQSLYARNHYYDIGYLDSENKCVNFSSVNDRANTSDVKTTLHTIPLSVARWRGFNSEQEIYITQDLKDKLSRDFPSASKFCIARKLP